MKTLLPDIIQFFSKQGFVVVSTIDGKGKPHNSCKGIVDIDSSGRVYLFDLYRRRLDTQRIIRISVSRRLMNTDLWGIPLKGLPD